MIDYILRLTFCSAFFIAIYYGFLQNERIYRFNRVYLILAAIASAIIPLLNFESSSVAIVAVEKIISDGSQYVGNNIINVESQNSFGIWSGKLIRASYLTIGSLLLIRLLVLNYILLQKAKRGKRKKLNDAILVLTSNNHPPHSYLNYIFISKSEFESHSIDEKIIDHECAHVHQRHTFDVLLVELLLVLFWFNPVFYLFRNAIRLNHEYLADDVVIGKHKNTTHYQYLIINNTARQNGFDQKSALSCPFNYIKTKKRLKMMTKMKITHRIVLKQCLLVPIIFGAVLIFSNTTIARDVKNVLEKEEATGMEVISLEETAITNNLELRKFIARYIKYPSAAAENKLQGKVEVFAKIDEEGKVGDFVKKPTRNSVIMLEEVVAVSYMPENAKDSPGNNDLGVLEKEVKRIMRKMPLIKIPELYGKTVGFTVCFELQEK